MNAKPSKAQQGLLQAMRAIDVQVAREMQRTPSQRAAHGVQKWEPFYRRVEDLTAFVLDMLGEQEVKLDGLLVLAQVCAKALCLACEDLGEDGLGQVRSAYCRDSFEKIAADCRRALCEIGQERILS